MSGENSKPTPNEVYAKFVAALIGWDGYLGFVEEFYAPDATHELPFAPPGVPKVTAGKEQILALMAAGAQMSPFRYDEVRNPVLRLADGGETLIAEHEIVGHVEATGKTFAHPGVLFLSVRDGKITRFREYSDPLAAGEALGDTPSYDLT